MYVGMLSGGIYISTSFFCRTCMMGMCILFIWSYFCLVILSIFFKINLVKYCSWLKKCLYVLKFYLNTCGQKEIKSQSSSKRRGIFARENLSSFSIFNTVTCFSRSRENETSFSKCRGKNKRWKNVRVKSELTFKIGVRTQ